MSISIDELAREAPPGIKKASSLEKMATLLGRDNTVYLQQIANSFGRPAEETLELIRAAKRPKSGINRRSFLGLMGLFLTSCAGLKISSEIEDIASLDPDRRKRVYKSNPEVWDPIYGPGILWFYIQGLPSTFAGHKKRETKSGRVPTGGVDYDVHSAPVYAAADGYIRSIDSHWLGGLRMGIIHNEDGGLRDGAIITKYSHLSRIDEKIRKLYDSQRERTGSARIWINRGDFIADSGNSGGGDYAPIPPQLDFSVWIVSKSFSYFSKKDVYESNDVNPETHGIIGTEPVFWDTEKTDLNPLNKWRKLKQLYETMEARLMKGVDEGKVDKIVARELLRLKGRDKELKKELVDLTLVGKEYWPDTTVYSLMLAMFAYSSSKLILTLPFDFKYGLEKGYIKDTRKAA